MGWDDLPEAAGNPYAWDALGDLPTYSPIADANNLCEAMRRSRKGTAWKESVQRFCWYYLKRITILQRQLYALEHGLPGRYAPQEGFEFFVNERGRIRPITGQVIDDRVVSHSLNDFALVPAIRPHLIYDNMASLEGRGVDRARDRVRVHLERYYRREDTNVGFIRLKDQSKYYDNIRHREAYAMLCGFTDDALARKLVAVLLNHARTDVSDLTDEEYHRCMKEKFDRVAWRNENHGKAGRRFLQKGLAVGDQLSQTIGIMYPWRVDNEATIVRGSRYYARYMDDSMDIDRDLDRLRQRGRAIDAAADAVGMYTNTRKTCIARLDKGFIYLQRKFRLCENGTVEMRLRPKAIARIRRRIRRLKRKEQEGKITALEVSEMAKSWLYARRDAISYPQMRSVELLILELYGKEAYSHVYDHSEKWRATYWIDDEWQHVRVAG